MPHRPRILLTLVLIGRIAAPSGASPAADSGAAAGPITLAEAEALALAASPALRAAAARIRQEEGHLRQAGLYPNPEMGLESNWFTDGLEPRETLLNLRQPVPWHGKRGLEQKEAAERIEAARSDAESARLDLLLHVRESFYRIGFTAKILAVAGENLETARAIRAAVEARIAAGDAAPFEGLKAAVEVSRAESESRRIEGSLQADVAVFNLLLGLPAGAPTVVAEPPAPAQQEADLQALLEQALAAQPEIRAREHAALAAGLAADRARKEPRPDIAIGPTFGTDQGDPLVGLGLSLRLPVWNHAQGAVASADAARDEAQAATEMARLSVSGLVADAFGRSRSAGSLRRLYEEGLLDQADRLVDLTRKSYEGGATGILDLLDARRTALAVQVEYFRACLDAAVAAARLRRAVGEESGTAP